MKADVKSKIDDKKAKAKAVVPDSKVDDVLFDRHDAFNLVALPIVVILNLLYFQTTYTLDFSASHGSGWPRFENTSLAAVPWADSANYYSFMLYVLLDMLWLILYPRSVSSAGPIVYHHVGVLVGWTMPLFDQHWAFWAALAAMIEVNTFFLVLRRQQGRDLLIVHVLFYLTWGLMRVVVYPLCLLFFSIEYVTHSLAEYRATGGFTAALSGLSLELLLLFLNALNASWTLDLARKTLRREPVDKEKRGL